MIPISSHILQQAIELYLDRAYPGETLPPLIAQRVAPIRALDRAENVPEQLLEKDATATCTGLVLRLGQPLYPHMKLIIEPAPACDNPLPAGFLLRVDTHDRHLHAPPGSPDAAWLASIRASNKKLTEHIESAWSDAHLPTFKDFLRRQIDARKAQRAAEPSPDSTL